MHYEVASSSIEERLEVTISGEAREGNAEGIARDVIEAVKQAAAERLLIDVRPLRGRLSVAQTYFHVRGYPPDAPYVRTAVIDLEENRSYFEFQEVTSRNTGRNIRFFTEIEEARAWLGASPDEKSK